MLNQNQVNKVNLILKDKVFKYRSPIILNVDFESDIDYTFEILGYKKMISVGEWYDYIKVSVNIINLNDDISKIILSSKLTSEKAPFYFKRVLTNDISQILSMFDVDNNRVLIEEINFKVPKEEIVNESTMSRLAIRTAVKDIIKKIKKKKSGFFYLPEESDEYKFTNLPFTFTVELTLKASKMQDRFKVNGYYVPDEDVVEVLILFNPEKIESQMYELVGEINELMAHELEHGRQEYKGEFLDKDEEPEESLPYYTQEHEIPAQYRGFKRLSKLTKKPIDVIAKEWFENNKDIHEMNDEEIKIVIDKILDYGKQK